MRFGDKRIAGREGWRDGLQGGEVLEMHIGLVVE
jgi:hypothetical protein